MSASPKDDDRQAPRDPERRNALGAASSLAMVAGMAGSYGLFAFMAGRFLYPARPAERRWMYVARVDRFNPGESLLYQAPTGETINVARQGEAGGVEDFIALSSVCPHLGCQVQWEPQNDRFFCPCHNGVFTPSGQGIAGPPGDAGQSLSRYRLKVDNDLLFIDVPVDGLSAGAREGRILERAPGIHGPGHDPCLARAGSAGPDGESA